MENDILHKFTKDIFWGVFLFLLLSLAVFMVWDRVKPPELKSEHEVGWREDFSDIVVSGKNIIPRNWKIKGKPGTPVSVFTVKEGSDKESNVLFLASDKSSGSLVTLVKDIDLEETPIMRWRWKADILPENADGRQASKDDQAIGIYIGDGSLLNSKSVSYRWDTITPKLTEGDAVYGMGAVKVKWITLRNSEDAGKGEWVTENRDVLSDFEKAWRFVPKKLYVSVTTNSQYTSTRAAAQLDWIEFTSDNKK